MACLGAKAKHNTNFDTGIDMSAQRQLQSVTYADYLQISDGKRYELIQGQFWLMAGAGMLHQRAVGELFLQLATQLKGKPCRVFIAPFDVR